MCFNPTAVAALALAGTPARAAFAGTNGPIASSYRRRRRGLSAITITNGATGNPIENNSKDGNGFGTTTMLPNGDARDTSPCSTALSQHWIGNDCDAGGPAGLSCGC